MAVHYFSCAQLEDLSRKTVLRARMVCAKPESKIDR